MRESKWLNGRLAEVQPKLAAKAHSVSRPVISRLLHAAGYALRLNVKALESCSHPQRDEQFQYIQAQRAQHIADGQPHISVDTKKKELIGDFKNPGRSMSCAAGHSPRSALQARAPDGGTALNRSTSTTFHPMRLGARCPMGSPISNTTVEQSIWDSPPIRLPLP